MNFQKQNRRNVVLVSFFFGGGGQRGRSFNVLKKKKAVNVGCTVKPNTKKAAF